MSHSNQTLCKPEQVHGFLRDTLSSAEQASFITHLDQCSDCRQLMQQSAGDATDWETVTTALRETDSHEFPDAIQIASGSVARSKTIATNAWELAWVSPWLGAPCEPNSMGRIGLFEAIQIVGVGGTGVVFLAKEPALGRNVAIKVLNPQMAKSEIARQRFEREARSTAGLVHDNIISIYQVSEWRGLPYLVMQYFPEGSLQTYLTEHEKIGLELAIQIAVQVAQGLTLAHAQGIVHRDIKPANILLSNNTQRAVLSDFGLARSDADVALTRTGILAGTPQFMSPEQARGEEVDQRSDLFSLGSLLFTMLAGHPPLHNENEVVAIERVASGRLPSLSEALPETPGWLVEMIGCLLSGRKENRPDSAGDVVAWLLQALAHVRDPEKNIVPTNQSLQRAIKSPSVWTARKVVLWAGALLLAGAFVYSSTWFMMPNSREKDFSDRLLRTANHLDYLATMRGLHFSAEPGDTKYELAKVIVEYNDGNYGSKVKYDPLVNVIERGEDKPKPGVFYFRLALDKQYTVRSTWILKDNYRVDAAILELEDKLDWNNARPEKVTLLPPDAR